MFIIDILMTQFWNGIGRDLEWEKPRKIKGFMAKIPKFQNSKKIYTPLKTICLPAIAGGGGRGCIKIFWNFGILEFWVKNPGKSRLSGIPNPFQILKSV